MEDAQHQGSQDHQDHQDHDPDDSAQESSPKILPASSARPGAGAPSSQTPGHPSFRRQRASRACEVSLSFLWFQDLRSRYISEAGYKVPSISVTPRHHKPPFSFNLRLQYRIIQTSADTILSRLAMREK